MSQVTGSLNALDYIIFVLYFAGLIGMSWWFSRSQESQEDYYVGGRDLPWWAVGISTAATQTSAIGFMSIPAFVAMKPGGGLKILQGEFILPFAMIVIMVTLIPFFRKLELVSVYQYLEGRFGPSVKYLISGVFLFSRGLGTAVGLYMTAIVFSTITGWPLWLTIVVVGGVTLIYDTLGGMKAVVYSDVIQMFVLLLGAGLIVGFAVYDVGGIAATRAALATMPERVAVLDFAHHGLGDGGEWAFWPQFFGGFFLLASYYGADQTQTQRELSAATLAETRKSLVFNGFFRFPLLLLYTCIGLAMAAYVANNDGFAQSVASMGQLDYMLPLYIMNVLPSGLKALIFVAVLAAAMSSLDSSINSLSAATQTDFVQPLLFGGKDVGQATFLRWSKITTVVWGAIVTAVAFFVGAISDTVIEAIGKVGSAFYGPILAAFLVGVLLPRVNTGAVFIGIVAGVAFNIVLWLTDAPIFWMWWNLFGCVIAVLVALAVSYIAPSGPLPAEKERFVLRPSAILEGERAWLPTYALLIGYAGVMVLVSWLLPKIILP